MPIGVNGKGKSVRNQEMRSLISRISSKSVITRPVVFSPERAKAFESCLVGYFHVYPVTLQFYSEAYMIN